MKKAVFFILEEYADWESAYLSSFLNFGAKKTWEVKTASLKKEPIHSAGNFCTLPDYALDEIPEDIDALILVGGMQWMNEAANAVIPLVQKLNEKGAIVGGICLASAFLGRCGVLNDVKHTSNEINQLKGFAGSAYTNEANYLLEPAVRDKNIITANGTAPLEFTKEVLKAMQAVPDEYIDSWYDFQKLGCYKAPMPPMPPQ